MREKEKITKNAETFANFNLLKFLKEMAQKFKQAKENLKKSGY